MELVLHNKLKDIENAPAFDKTCHPRCDPSRAVHPLAKKIIHIPHVQIADNLNLDASIIRNEIDALENWHGYNNDVKGTRGAGISTYWSAKFLRNFSNDPDFGFGETLDYMEILGKRHLIKNGRVPPEHLVDTTLCEQVPYIKSIVEKMFTWNMCDRIMISKVDNKQRINWHSHNYYETEYTHAYVHIPLITNENAQMLVYMDNELHVQHYSFNQAWVINTQHNHAVNNKQGHDRYHVLCLVNFEDPKLAALLS
jgi:hypothetical protein